MLGSRKQILGREIPRAGDLDSSAFCSHSLSKTNDSEHEPLAFWETPCKSLFSGPALPSASSGDFAGAGHQVGGGSCSTLVRAAFRMWEGRAHRGKELGQARGSSLCQTLQRAPAREVESALCWSTCPI